MCCSPAQLSESEAEDDPASHVTLPQKITSRGNIAAGQSAIRLIELGPRLTLQVCLYFFLCYGRWSDLYVATEIYYLDTANKFYGSCSYVIEDISMKIPSYYFVTNISVFDLR